MLELYLAKSMADLNEMVDSSGVSRSNAVSLVKMVPTVIDEAKKKEKMGDMEMAYVLYMRVFKMYGTVVTTKEYQKDKVYYDEMMGKSANFAITKSETIANNLERRYSKKASVNVLTKTPNNNVEVKGDNGMANNSDTKKKSNLEYRKESYTDVKKTRTDTKTPSVKDSSGSEVSSMTPRRLHEILQMRSTSLLILDIRPFDDYRTTQINHPQTLNIDEKLLGKTITAKGIEKSLSIDNRDLFSRRHKFDIILMVDWRSSEVKDSKALGYLRDAMIKWDENNESVREKLHLLQDGFYAFVLRYPLEVTNPARAKHLMPPKKKTDLEDPFKTPDLANVSYPQFLDNGHIEHKLNKSTKDLDGMAPDSSLDLKSNSNRPSNLLPSKNASDALASGAVEVKRLKPSIPDRSSKPIKPANHDINNHVTVNGNYKVNYNNDENKSIRNRNESANEDKNSINAAKNGEAPIVDRGSKANVLLRDPNTRVKTNDARWESLRREKEREAEAELRLELQKNEDLLSSRMKELSLDKKKQEEENARLRQQIDDLKSKIFDNGDSVKVRSSDGKEEDDKDDDEIRTNGLSKRIDVPKNSDSSSTRREPLKDRASSPTLSSGQLNRSHSSPNIAQMLEEENQRLGAIPAPKFDRSCKPSGVEARARNFQPVWGTGKKGLTGLKNLGNTCFMNSVLQCVANFTLPSQYFIDQIFRRDLNSSSDTKGNVALEFSEVVKALWCGQYKYISPVDLKSTLGRYKNEYAGTQQQDAHEFLLVLMDWLHSDVNEVHRKPILPELELEDMDELKAAEKAAQRERMIERSFIRETFFGQRRSTLQCLTCRHASVTYEAFFEISIPLPEGSGRCSLGSCMESFLKPEIVDWTCPKCKCDRRSRKQLELVRLPLILTVHFSRFFEDSNGIWRKKQNLVDFPLTDVNFDNFVTGCQGRLNRHGQYNLHGVCNHFGTMEGGHYTAYCYSQVYEQWHKYDDHEVSVMGVDKVRTPAAYILFYLANGADKVELR